MVYGFWALGVRDEGVWFWSLGGHYDPAVHRGSDGNGNIHIYIYRHIHILAHIQVYACTDR